MKVYLLGYGSLKLESGLNMKLERSFNYWQISDSDKLLFFLSSYTWEAVELDHPGSPSHCLFNSLTSSIDSKLLEGRDCKQFPHTLSPECSPGPGWEWMFHKCSLNEQILK